MGLWDLFGPYWLNEIGKESAEKYNSTVKVRGNKEARVSKETCGCTPTAPSGSLVCCWEAAGRWRDLGRPWSRLDTSPFQEKPLFTNFIG